MNRESKDMGGCDKKINMSQRHLRTFFVMVGHINLWLSTFNFTFRGGKKLEREWMEIALLLRNVFQAGIS